MKLSFLQSFGVLLCILMCVSCGLRSVTKQELSSISTHTTTVNGQTRAYKVVIPTKIKGDPLLPLVIALHGNGGNAETLIKETKWDVKATTENFILVAPEASRPIPNKPRNQRNNRQTWNDGSGRFHSGVQNIDDVKFIMQMLDELESRYPINKNQIFVTGFSNGASMTFRLAMEVNRIAAIAPVAGINWMNKASVQHPISLLYIIGAQDNAKPMGGGVTKMANGRILETTVKPAIYTNIEKWATLIDCPSKPSTFTLSEGLTGLRFTNCANNTQIEYIIVDNLGHVWPGATQLVPKAIVGSASNKLNATDYIWDFFKKEILKQSSK